MQRIEAIVKGKVQGVFFRAFVQAEALKLGLTGFVQNLSDGSVKVVAEGEKPLLEKLVKQLWKGSPASKVEEVLVEWKNALNCFKSFEIKRSFF
jgi:acylphosphatase